VHEHWSTPEEERTFALVRDFLMEMRDRGSGIYIKPVTEQMEAYGVDGWVVGRFGPDGPEDLAVGPWLDQVLETARETAD
jgi:hypothetical protein